MDRNRKKHLKKALAELEKPTTQTETVHQSPAISSLSVFTATQPGQNTSSTDNDCSIAPEFFILPDDEDTSDIMNIDLGQSWGWIAES